MANKTLDEAIREARAHAVALIAERKDRGGKHLDDHRIPTEIAAHLFQLGRQELELREENQRMVTRTERNNSTIEEIRCIYGLLQRELDIATHRETPAPP